MNRLDKALSAWGMGKKTSGRLGAFSFTPSTLRDAGMSIAARTNIYEGSTVVACRRDCLGANIDTVFDPALHLRAARTIVMADTEFGAFLRAITIIELPIPVSQVSLLTLQSHGAALMTLRTAGERYGWGSLINEPEPTSQLTRDLIIAGAKRILTHDALVLSRQPIRELHSCELGKYYYAVRTYDEAFMAKMKNSYVEVIDLKDQSS